MENDFEVYKEGKSLIVGLGKELSAINAKPLTEEILKYYNQDVEKVVFASDGLAYISSAGLRVVFSARNKIVSKPEIVFVNCDPGIVKVLDHVGLTQLVKFEENPELSRKYRTEKLKNIDRKTLQKMAGERRELLDNYEAHNDIVCYSMKLGEEEE